MLRRTGFADILFVGMTGFSTSPFTAGALFRARKKSGLSDVVSGLTHNVGKLF